MVRRPWYMRNTRAKVKFTVLPVVDLRHMPGVKEPSLKTSTEKDLRPGRVTQGLVIMPKSGYVPGEEIPTTVHVANNSSRPIVRMELRVVEHSRFIGFFNRREVCTRTDPCLDGHVKDYKDVVGFLKESVHVAPQSEREYKRSIRVPEKAMMVHSCPIIQVGYALEVVIVTDGFLFKEVSDSLPITVGTLPTASIVADGPASTTAGDPPPSYPASEFGS
ncbi:Protein ARRD-24 [Aphelenchoides avenae]|nr:Protein ARRD-24 [Aphelenchus avenae]